MAPFSFIKISTLIFAYLFLWYQTNYHHQVSALSSLKDDDVSDTTSLTSSEEDINKTHGRLKTLQSDGPHVPHKGYGDYRPPQGRGEPSLRRGGGGTSPPFGGQYPHPTSRYGTPKKDHVNSKYGTSNFGTLNSGTPKNKSFSRRSKRVKDVLKALWKKCVCQGNKHRRLVIIFAVVIMVVLYLLFLQFGCSGIGGTHHFLFPKSMKMMGESGSDVVINIYSAVEKASNTAGGAYVIPAIIGILVIGALFGFYCWKREQCNKREKF
ncbi:hypothetical protein, conserved in P.knowlesi [Plasmodium knowlesi strain H]|uniref:Transmembrane protein n=3 Tax=Plasmodium knowlesi TaxID=5850 RepID=A0A5K1VBY8_PLAKH|nr:uncharacterized protein PKNH_1454700 [Plasmodium knowlesi strain H]OTN64105.1 Uncharacterized protein PKNOH_S140272900 [Plasmodium knowlesi]CAA9991143.1 hypothetical protein, conserved in P.knowlesi [Plasmodium knowlesi strain H]SBO20539.1 hypothetical protein, conserved in P.knowlesi [Plasmodium knowlesi strain H]SBO20913.1 hypothetical protein, conserved in P.knowlesi [Plasmodium knowlesi strain H]VVS80617.1 hypothetical protein, conserved in P.knowlesi [Plasmodium knowlesi strain H]|eukprot:XP_002262427.1 [Plasmodium knowlesi strain H]